MGINTVCSAVIIKGLYCIQSSHFITVLLIAALLLRCIDYPLHMGQHCNRQKLSHSGLTTSFPQQQKVCEWPLRHSGNPLGHLKAK